MGICAFPPSWMWGFDAVGVVFAILTATTLVFRHRHLGFTATVTLVVGVFILVATVVGPLHLLLTVGDTGGVDDVASAALRWGAFRKCFAEGGLGCVIPLFFGAVGTMVERVARRRAAAPTPIPPAMPHP
jgi:hypothetical protein